MVVENTNDAHRTAIGIDPVDTGTESSALVVAPTSHLLSYDDQRDWCIVPDCDEQPYPGDSLCMSHLLEGQR